MVKWISEGNSEVIKVCGTLPKNIIAFLANCDISRLVVQRYHGAIN